MNFEVTYYIELIDWNVVKLSTPPLLRRTTNEEIASFIESGDKPDWHIKNFHFARNQWSRE